MLCRYTNTRCLRVAVGCSKLAGARYLHNRNSRNDDLTASSTAWKPITSEKKVSKANRKQSTVPGISKQIVKNKGVVFWTPRRAGKHITLDHPARSRNFPQSTGRNSAVGSVCQYANRSWKASSHLPPFPIGAAGQSPRVLFGSFERTLVGHLAGCWRQAIMCDAVYAGRGGPGR